MKRNNLTTAILAGITGVAGIASVSNAVNLNPDGLGQVLVFPYYTVNKGLNTLISVVNTTNEYKAVKVRFLEGKNSRECLDFNLYMSPYDVWTSALVAAPSTVPTVADVGPFTDQNSVALITDDQSCTVPRMYRDRNADGSLAAGEAPFQEFLPYAYIDSGTSLSGDGLGETLQRCTEGHFEIIEMAVIDASTDGVDQAAILHDITGVPGSCATIRGNWSKTPVGQWRDVATATTNIAPPTGGIFGSASIIDVANGTDVSYNADAIEGFANVNLHREPESLQPNLDSGTDDTSHVFSNGIVKDATWASSNIQAVSALYMHDNIYGEYVLDDNIGAETEWVVTFPTKWAYVDAALNVFGGAPYEPFTDLVDLNGGLACEEYTVTGLYDREEQTADPSVIDVVPSPPPPGVAADRAFFCWEANVVEFNDSNITTGDSSILGSKLTTHLQTRKTSTTYFDAGWVSINFSSDPTVTGDHETDDNVDPATSTAVNYVGLPVTGFAIQKYTNSNLTGGVLANYAGLFAHRYSKNITP